MARLKEPNDYWPTDQESRNLDMFMDTIQNPEDLKAGIRYYAKWCSRYKRIAYLGWWIALWLFIGVKILMVLI